MPALDRAIGDALPHVHLLSGSTIDDARELLGTITTAMMTVTSLTFSLTVVTLQLASGQYSPRLLRTFARDRFVQTTMALFLATFAYALTVLKNIQNGPRQTVYAVPHIAVSLAAALALAHRLLRRRVGGKPQFRGHGVGGRAACRSPSRRPMPR